MPPILIADKVLGKRVESELPEKFYCQSINRLVDIFINYGLYPTP